MEALGTIPLCAIFFIFMSWKNWPNNGQVPLSGLGRSSEKVRIRTENVTQTTGAIKMDKQNHFIYLLLCTLLNTSCIRQQGFIIKLSTELFI